MVTDVLSEPLPPIHVVQLATQPRCNANCVFCPYIEAPHAKAKGVMPLDLFYKILEELKEFPLINSPKGRFHPYLIQDPLLDKQIVEKLETIHAYFPETNISISTNPIALAPALHDRLIDLFSKLPRHEFIVSYHGINPESMRHIMALDFERSEANMVAFLKKAGGRMDVEVKGLGSSRFKDLHYFTQQDYETYWERLFEKHQIDSSRVKVHYGVFHDRAGTIRREERDAKLITVGQVREIDAEHPFYCPQIDRWIQIDWDGNLRWCCMDWPNEISLPNMKDITLREYFASDRYKTLVAMTLGTVESPADFICKRCTWPINDDNGKHMQNLLVKPSAADPTRNEPWESGGTKQEPLFQLRYPSA